jgi:hypothetical protein
VGRRATRFFRGLGRLEIQAEIALVLSFFATPFIGPFLVACEKFHKFSLRVRGAVRTLLSNVRSLPATALLFSCAIGFSGCGPRVADRNIDAVNRLYDQARKSGKELSPKEVEAVLGQPSWAEPFHFELETPKELQGVRYYYKQDGHTIELHFVDNKLINKIDHFEDANNGAEESEQLKMQPHQPK